MHSEVEGEGDFSPVFPNLPDASQKSITVLNQVNPGSLNLPDLDGSKIIVVVSTVHKSTDTQQ